MKTQASASLDLLPFAAACLAVAHHIPGRIRLKLALSAEKSIGAMLENVKALGDALDKSPAIRSVNLNLLAKSCTIEYDPERIAPGAWQDLVSGVKSPAVEALVAAIFEVGPTPKKAKQK